MILESAGRDPRGPVTPTLSVGRVDTVEAHGLRVGRYALMLARAISLPAVDCEEIALAGSLHDIGKYRLPQELLTKPSSLDAEERALMLWHPDLGAAMLRSTGSSESVIRIVRHHHERWNGSGYPTHARGGEIPIGARVIAVADTFDALVSDRPYRKARTSQDAVSELLRVKGTHLEPRLVDAFVRGIGSTLEGGEPLPCPTARGRMTALSC